jgi:hypothetical protein
MRFFAAAVMTGLVTVGCSTSPPAEPQMTDSQVEDRIMAQYATEPSLQRAD